MSTMEPAEISESLSPGDALVTLERRGRVLLMGINRPDRKNAFNVDLLRALSAAYTLLEDDPTFWCGLLFAHGNHFTAGLDLPNVAPLMLRGEIPFAEDSVDPWGIVRRHRSKPVVCAVQGRCFTLGIELVLASDICVGASDATFVQAEISRGIFPIGGATFRMPAVCGWGNAMRYLLTGESYDAHEALRIGMLQEVVEPGRQLDRALELARIVARQAPLGTQATLRSAWLAAAEGVPAAASALRGEIMKLAATQDAREGVASFIQRREPNFSGT